MEATLLFLLTRRLLFGDGFHDTARSHACSIIFDKPYNTIFLFLRVAIMKFKYTIGTTSFTMILLVPTRILAIFDHRFTMTFATSMYFLFKNHD